MDKDHFIHPNTDFATIKSEGSQLIFEAERGYVTDSNGKKLLDGIGGS